MKQAIGLETVALTV